MTNYHKCSVWDACLLDVSYVRNLQQDDHNDYQKGTTFLVIGITLTCVFVVFCVVFVACVIRKCCCKRKQEPNTISYNGYSPVTLKTQRVLEISRQRDIYYRNYRDTVLTNPAFYLKWVNVVNDSLSGPFQKEVLAKQDADSRYVFGGYVTQVGNEATVDIFQPEDFPNLG